MIRGLNETTHDKHWYEQGDYQKCVNRHRVTGEFEGNRAISTEEAALVDGNYVCFNQSEEDTNWQEWNRNEM